MRERRLEFLCRMYKNMTLFSKLRTYVNVKQQRHFLTEHFQPRSQPALGERDSLLFRGDSCPAVGHIMGLIS